MIGLVHLVWAPLGPEPLRAFLRSYRAHPAGAEHELVFMLNGTHANGGEQAAPLSREEALAELEGTEHRAIVLEQPLLDLAAYGRAAELLEHRRLCFLNSYSVILADGWLGHLARAAEQPAVGLVGASGSWESQGEWMRGEPRNWTRQLSAVLAARRDYPRFPNPHVRTTAFMLDRQTALELDLRRARDKRGAYLLESGWHGITRQILDSGRRAVVVGRDGRAYDVEEWPQSRTYRSGEQENLLIADNRTEDWRRAPRRVRRRLSRDAWGEPDPPGNRRPGAYAPKLPTRSAALKPPTPATAPKPPARSIAPEQTAAAERAPAAQPDAAVVIVNYRTPELVERCLESVRATRGELELEAVVIDNASPDGSVERLRAALPDANVIAMQENRGFAAGVNAGFGHTAAEVVIVLNPDTEVRADALPTLVEHLRSHPATGLVAPLLEDSDGQLAANGYRRFPGLFTLGLDMCLPVSYALSYAPALHPYAIPPSALLSAGGHVVHVCGAAMAIRRSAYTDAGALDEGFFLYLEETEWQRRVAAHGWAIEIAPAARVCHLVRGGEHEALVPSPHFVPSAVRYLRMQGVPRPVSRAVLAAALAASWATLRLIACLPAKRPKAAAQARAYGSLLRRTLTGAQAPRE